MFTDNLVAEYAYYKSSTMLFDLVLCMKNLQVIGEIIFHVTHISEFRIQKYGVDVLSRGNTTKREMVGNNLFSYLYLYMSAFERSKWLLDWVKYWWLKNEILTPLKPEGWFAKVLTCGNFLSLPPPTVDDALVEQLC